jgi:hypothetical protein
MIWEKVIITPSHATWESFESSHSHLKNLIRLVRCLLAKIEENELNLNAIKHLMLQSNACCLTWHTVETECGYHLGEQMA